MNTHVREVIAVPTAVVDTLLFWWNRAGNLVTKQNLLRAGLAGFACRREQPRPIYLNATPPRR